MYIKNMFTLLILHIQAISACEQALCRLTLCFEFQSTSQSTKGHKSCALQMGLRNNVQI